MVYVSTLLRLPWAAPMFRKGTFPGNLLPDLDLTICLKVSSAAEINMKKGVWSEEPMGVIEGDYANLGPNQVLIFPKRRWFKIWQICCEQKLCVWG